MKKRKLICTIVGIILGVPLGLVIGYVVKNYSNY
jgi:ABC-type lipoprotein release transport system permease subunit